MESLRKNPKQRRSKELVSSIMEATSRVLKETGYVKASTQRIAEVAGVGIGSVYEYFKDKNSIISNLMDENMDRVCGGFDKKVDQIEGETPLEIANAMIDLVFKEFLTERDFIRELYLQAAQLGKVDRLLEHRQRMVVRLTKLLREKKPDFENPEAFTFITVHSVMGIVYSYLYCKEVTIDPEALKNEFKLLIRSRLEGK